MLCMVRVIPVGSVRSANTRSSAAREVRVTDAERFLTAVFGGARSGFVLCWTLPDRRSRFFTTDRLSEAARYAIDLACTHDLYVGCALHDHDHGAHERGRAEDV